MWGKEKRTGLFPFVIEMPQGEKRVTNAEHAIREIRDQEGVGQSPNKPRSRGGGGESVIRPEALPRIFDQKRGWKAARRGGRKLRSIIL